MPAQGRARSKQSWGIVEGRFLLGRRARWVFEAGAGRSGARRGGVAGRVGIRGAPTPTTRICARGDRPLVPQGGVLSPTQNLKRGFGGGVLRMGGEHQIAKYGCAVLRFWSSM
jgi:hypothetical protein